MSCTPQPAQPPCGLQAASCHKAARRRPCAFPLPAGVQPSVRLQCGGRRSRGHSHHVIAFVRVRKTTCTPYVLVLRRLPARFAADVFESVPRIRGSRHTLQGLGRRRLRRIRARLAWGNVRPGTCHGGQSHRRDRNGRHQFSDIQHCHLLVRRGLPPLHRGTGVFVRLHPDRANRTSFDRRHSSPGARGFITQT